MRNYSKYRRIRKRKRVNSGRIKRRNRNKGRIYQKTRKQNTYKKRSRRSRRKRLNRTQAKQYRTHAKRPIMGDREWDSIFKFERKWGVMRRGRGWPRH